MLAERVSYQADIVYQSLKHSYGDAVDYENRYGDVGSGMDATLHQPVVVQRPLAPGVVAEDAAVAAGTVGSLNVADGGDKVQAARPGGGDA